MSVTLTSKEALKDNRTQKKIISDTKSILTYLEVNQDYPYTSIKMASCIAVDYYAIQRRMGEIVASGKVIIAKNVTENGYKVQQYQWNKDGIKQERKPTKFEKLNAILRVNLSEDQYNTVMEEFNKIDL